MVGAVRDKYPELELSLHLHDTRGMGLANAYAGLQMGVKIFDAAVAGLGGCPFASHSGASGNVCTEDLVFMCHEMGIETGIDLEKIIASIQTTAAEVGVTVVTGDTKVVERGKCDGIYINTAGIGRVVSRQPVGGAQLRPGDAVVVSGLIGEHGIAVLSRRAGIAFQTSVVSDCAPLWQLVKAVLASGAEVHAMRDPTRGGLAATVWDFARASQVGIRLQETAVPVSPAVRGACDLLGLDPLSIANEGKLVVVCRGADADRVVQALRSVPLGRGAVVSGEVIEKPKGLAVLRTAIGGERIIDLPTGEDLPRIC